MYIKKLIKRGLISLFVGAGITAFLQNIMAIIAGAVSGSPAYFDFLSFIKLSLLFSLVPFLILTIISLFSKNRGS